MPASGPHLTPAKLDRYTIFDNFSGLVVFDVDVFASGVIDGVTGKLNGGLVIGKKVDSWVIPTDKCWLARFHPKSRNHFSVELIIIMKG